MLHGLVTNKRRERKIKFALKNALVVCNSELYLDMDVLFRAAA